MLERIDCLKLLAPMITDELVAIGIAGVNWEWRFLSKHEGNMTIGTLGHTLAAGTGMALSLPHRRVIVLESDGSSLADLPCLTTIGTYRPENLKVFVFDNELYSGSRISDPSATAYNTDLEQMARGAGIPTTATVRDVESFGEQARLAFSQPGVRYVVAKVGEGAAARKLPRPREDYLETKYRFVRYIERTEGKTIFPEQR
jgi:thiamine pyrophosphate-dependent acetolactate synthase large subunit-like protein